MGLAVIAVGIANMTDIQKDRYLSLTGDAGEASSGSANGRVAFMGRMYSLFLNKPIFGHGLGTSAEAGANAGQDAKIAHSLYLEILIELGFIGFIIFMIFIKRLYNEINKIIKYYEADSKPNRDKAKVQPYSFDAQLAIALKACFWMFAVFSIAYFGLSREWWYFMAGVIISLSNLTQYKANQLSREA
jgi:O-antigen ligase